MYCNEHLVFKLFGDRVYLWMYWKDVPRNKIPLRIWMNPLRYEFFIRAFGLSFVINANGMWSRTVPASMLRIFQLIKTRRPN